MVVAVQLKWGVACACIFCIIIINFGYRQESSLVILFKIDENSKVGLHNAVLPFGLAVNLKVKGDGKLPLDSEEITKQWPKFGDE